jgi:hypothetical protein
VVQSWQEAFPVPHAVSTIPATQVPVESQHPVQDGPQAPPLVDPPLSSPVVTPLEEVAPLLDALE